MPLPNAPKKTCRLSLKVPDDLKTRIDRWQKRHGRRSLNSACNFLLSFAISYAERRDAAEEHRSHQGQ